MDNSKKVLEEDLECLVNGFTSDQLPSGMFKEIFDKEILKEVLKVIKTNFKSGKLACLDDFGSKVKFYNKHGGSECLFFFAYKKDGNTRNMGVINPKYYSVFVYNLLSIKNEWLEEIYRSESDSKIIDHSNSQILVFKNYEALINNMNYTEDSDIIDDEFSVFNISKHKNNFNNNIKKSKKIEGWYTHYLETDFESFYDNIYTHKLENLSDYLPYKELIEKKHVNVAEFFEFLDVFNRRVNRNQTKGIIQGPISSNISAELLSIAIDFKLNKEYGNDVNYVRYVDDHTFFSNDIGKLEKVRKKLNKIIKDFKLSLKSEKTIIKLGFKKHKGSNINEIIVNCPFLDKNNKKAISKSDLILQFMNYISELESKKDFSQIKASITSLINKIDDHKIDIDREVIDIFVPYILKLSFIDPFLATNCYSLIEKLIILSSNSNNPFIDTDTSLKNVIIDHLIECLDYVNEEFYESNIQIWHYYLIGKYISDDEKRNEILENLLDKCDSEHYSCDCLLIFPFVKENSDKNNDIFNHMKNAYIRECSKQNNGNEESDMKLDGISESRWWPLVLLLKKRGQQTIKDDLKPLFQPEDESEDGDSKIKEFGLFKNV